MAASITRLTLYALISSIEEDLRALLATYLPSGEPLTAILGENLFAKLVDRTELSPDNQMQPIETLLDFCDFGDSIQLANRYRSNLPPDLAEQLRSLDPSFTSLIATRNRVMHARPLEFDDLPQSVDTSEALLKLAPYWPSLAQTRQRLSGEPEYVLKLHIPFEPEKSSISHNLPLPDFDETGFIGRRSTAPNLVKAICGVYPVVTIVGEGGLGKTSLALKVAYDFLDSAQGKFDAIIFVSAKTQKLTNQEIERIKGSINTSVGLIEAAAMALGGDESRSLDDLIELLAQFRVLLIIDNLETVLDGNMRELMERVPEGSKIVITTRIRMGAFEFPIQLEALSSSEATLLLRATAKVRENHKLVATSDVRLSDYCRRMHNNPLHIKWFVTAVQAGQRPESVLADDRIFLQFCLSNVFNVLSEDARRLVRTLLSVGGSYTVAELSYLTSLDQTSLLKAIGELTRTNMFFAVSTPTDQSFETRYELSQLARSYLSKFYPVNKEEQQRMLQHKKKLVSAGEQILSESKSNPLAVGSIHCRNRSDWVTARHLRDALASIRAGEIDRALELIEEAKSLAPDFSEVHRIEAFAHSRAGNLTSAFDSYERAIEFDPNSAICHFLFGGFLLRDADDTEAAAREFKIASELCPNHVEPLIELARSLLYSKQFVPAGDAIARMEKMQLSHEWHKRKLIDLHLQLLTRKADYSQMTHQPSVAIEELLLVKNFYEKIDKPDFKMRERIAKLRLTAVQVRQQCFAANLDVATVENFLEWLDGVVTNPSEGVKEKAGQETLSNRGYVKSIHRSGKFGSIKQDDGTDIFFHMSRVKHPETLMVGSHVDFRLALDWRGRLFADQVTPN